MTTTLRSLAFLFGIGIVMLGMLLLNRDDTAPTAPVSPAVNATDSTAAPASSEPSSTHAPGESVPNTLANTKSNAAAGEANVDGTVLYGRVTDEAGVAIQDGHVWLTRAGQPGQVASISASSRDPCFAIAGVPPGELTFRTRAEGFRETTGTIVIPEGVSHLRHDFVLQGAWLLTVKILTPEGTPLRDAIAAAAGKERHELRHVEVGAVATAERPDGDFPPTGLREITHGVGRWRDAHGFQSMRGEKKQPKDVAGVLEIDDKRPVWISAVLRHRVLASIAVETGQAEATLTVALDSLLKDLGTIRGRVVDAATGEPLAKARVGFGDLQSSGMGTLTGDDARFEVNDLRPGLLTMQLSTEQARTGTLVLLQPGQILDLGDVPIAKSRTIKGRCEGIAGKAEDLSITTLALDPPPHAALRHQDGRARAAADGTFTLHVPEGRHRVRASGAGGAVTEIDTRTVGDQALVLQLAKEAPLRVDVQTNGAPMELAVFDASGREVYRRDMQHGWKLTLPFLPGTYRIELKDGRGKVDTRSVTLGDDGADLRVP